AAARRPGQRAVAAVHDRNGVAVAQRAVHVLLLDEGAAGDLGGAELGPVPVVGLGAAAREAGHRQHPDQGQGGDAGDGAGDDPAAVHLAPPSVPVTAPPPKKTVPPLPAEPPPDLPSTDRPAPPLPPPGPKALPQAFWASSNLGSDGSMPLESSIFIDISPPLPK